MKKEDDEQKKLKLAVKYHNGLNQVVMRRWKPYEMDIFFAILAKLKNQGTTEIILMSEELDKLCNFKGKSAKRWDRSLTETCEDIAQLRYYEDTPKVFRVVNLFEEAEYDKEKHTVKVQIYPKYAYILNDLTSNFTRFELAQFVDLESTYAKTAYRLLKQYRTTGVLRITLEKFYVIFDVPDGYKKHTSNINSRIIKPILDELSPIFKGLKVEKYYAKTGKRGHGPLAGFCFTFEPDPVQEARQERVKDLEEGKDYVKKPEKPVKKRKRTYGRGYVQQEKATDWSKKKAEEPPITNVELWAGMQWKLDGVTGAVCKKIAEKGTKRHDRYQELEAKNPAEAEKLKDEFDAEKEELEKQELALLEMVSPALAEQAKAKLTKEEPAPAQDDDPLNFLDK